MDANTIKHMIESGLPGAKVAIYSEDNHHFEAFIIHTGFNGKTLLERHRMVYETLGNSFQSNLHALALHTKTPEEEG
ncbi:BolA/IbaG family iron-sulfur metabolism protein [Candidatus Nitrosacidococcus sp. I8]|uniref:BolA/IbaG family iron-sulfur metabolism protein n=1 Tax=Candidatus Nitrosacidococcus sp. I8 TaxID=2942908 RepID=UPI002226D0FC|nr:BolA/IbaG family iron-sulfur metabolism protein [Candidatus Nitrosacidococcus sp. I8]CAH9019574.1 hypothetical protein NURINAE_01629 [Candidatus Nitrosacidococcus sp. I8]